MFILKSIIYSATIILTMYFGYRELRLKEELTNKTPPPPGPLSLPPETNQFSEGFRRERILNSLPKEARSQLNQAIALKFLFVGLLILEVLILQH